MGLANVPVVETIPVETIPTERPSWLSLSFSARIKEFATESRCETGMDFGVPMVVTEATRDEASDSLSSWKPVSGMMGSSRDFSSAGAPS
mmetsp:Transcript_4105/g.9595  ORF Transcript_4105/g.9595 Transcript_4105/m.9595 type:complete len:90 (+) Transcript_4105:344-613(+)